MEIIRSISEMKKKIKQLKAEKQTIGFVPTMGYFHEGHLKLMEEAVQADDHVIVSIFVNPLQFGPSEDYEQYPRDEKRDIKMAQATGADTLFIPTAEEMYPAEPAIKMNVTARTDVLCGRTRIGHFDGVVTVLTKLFNIVQPTRAYFGKKDAQQLAVVDLLINDFNFPVQLVGVPTAREGDGLAKSSRNIFLSDDERQEAVWINKALLTGKQLVVDGEKNTDIIVKEVTKMAEGRMSGSLDYVEMLSYPDMQGVIKVEGIVILAMAIRFKDARLIDNLIFDQAGNETTQISSQENISFG